jgi:hypothetical protein
MSSWSCPEVARCRGGCDRAIHDGHLLTARSESTSNLPRCRD